MNARTKIYILVIFFIVSLLAMLFGGYSWGARRTSAGQQVKCDTLFIRETLHVEKPIEVVREITKELENIVYVREVDTLRLIDTLWLPREVKIYEDSTYKCQVSGISPQLDWIETYRHREIITKNIVEYKPYRWGVGIQAGYGITLVDSKVRGVPYIGLGISYNFINFGKK